MIDKVKDTEGGTLFAALDQMRREQPALDFVYVDTYWTHGWTAWKLAEKMRELQLSLYTEGNASLDPWTTWSHWRGAPVRTMRFLWYGHRDLYGNDPLLREGQHKGFLSWHNEFDFHAFLRGVFGRNLPAKYLKHFDLLLWEPGQRARFSDGVEIVRKGNTITCTRNDRTIMTWNDKSQANRLFIPWPPKKETKIHVWDETGKPGEWELPPSWKGTREVFLYRLTALGRVDETRLPVHNGRVRLTVEKSTPYVIYQKQAPEQNSMVWGEGSRIKDPGFDSQNFTDWTHIPADAPHEGIRIESDKRGNARLVIGGDSKDGGAVSQQIGGLEAGGTYTASVWAQGRERRVALEILPLGTPGTKPIVNAVPRTTVRHKAPCDRHNGTYYQPLRVKFTLPAGCTEIRLTLRAGEGPVPSTAEFDDVRLVRSQPAPPAAKGHWFFEDFEAYDQNWGPFTWIVGERTHLSEANPPYTQDTINGHFSFKTMNEPNGLVARTVPASLLFEPWTRYRLHCETIGGSGAKYRLQVKNGSRTVFDAPVPDGRGTVKGAFVTRGGGEAYLALIKEAGGLCVLDDLAIDNSADNALTWGGGLALIWPGGQALRVNLRVPENRFGIDSTARAQQLTGKLHGGSMAVLRIRLTDTEVLAEAWLDDKPEWQTLARFPRVKFPGPPAFLRVGKMHAVEGLDDHTDPGPAGSCRIEWIRVHGK